MNMPDRNQMAQGAQRPSGGGGESLPKVKFENPGEEVFAHVTAFKQVTSDYGQAHLAELNDQQRGACTLWLNNVQLDTALVQGDNNLGRPIQPSDVIYVRFEGKQALEGGKSVSNFAIAVSEGPPLPQAQQPAPQPAPAPAPWPAQPQQAPAPQSQQPAPQPAPQPQQPAPQPFPGQPQQGQPQPQPFPGQPQPQQNPDAPF